MLENMMLLVKDFLLLATTRATLSTFHTLKAAGTKMPGTPVSSTNICWCPHTLAWHQMSLHVKPITYFPTISLSTSCAKSQACLSKQQPLLHSSSRHPLLTQTVYVNCPQAHCQNKSAWVHLKLEATLLIIVILFTCVGLLTILEWTSSHLQCAVCPPSGGHDFVPLYWRGLT